MNLFQNDFRWKYFAKTERATIVAKHNLHSFEKAGERGESFFTGVHGLDAQADKMACDMTVIVRSLLRSCVFETRNSVGMRAN